MCHDCYFLQIEYRDKKCPNCFKYYDITRVSESLKRTKRCYKNISSTQETYSSSNMSSYSMKGMQNQIQKQQKSLHKSPSQNKRTSSDNNRQPNNHAKLSAARILQKHILYIIGLAPSIAKEDTLRRYEYFGQYGRIQQITINKEKAFQSENQGICYSAYITYSDPSEASVAILACDQFVHENRLIRASFGRTKYCKFFLKQTQCLNKDCPYHHQICDSNEIVSQDVVKKQLFLQCQQLAFHLSNITTIDAEQFKRQKKTFRDQYYPNQSAFKSVFPNPECIFTKKAVIKMFAQQPFIQQNMESEPSDSSITQQIRVISRKMTASNMINEFIPTQNYNERNTSVQTPKNQLNLANQQNLRITSESQSSLTLNDALRTSESLKFLNTPQSFIRSVNQDNLKNQASRRNTSQEDTKSNQESLSRSRVQDFEMHIANQLKRHLGPFDTPTNLHNCNIDTETEKSHSIFDEKKASRFLSMRDYDEDNEDDIGLKDSMLHSRRSSICKKGSMQSLIVESLRFLNDDTDVVPNKREPLICPQQFRAGPPSEAFNIKTPAQSQMGGFDDDYGWNNTIFSHQEWSAYQRCSGQIDDRSYYSHQFYQGNAQDNRNSVLTSSVATNNPNFQGVYSTQALNDSTLIKNSSQNTFMLPNQALYSSQNFSTLPNQSQSNYPSRKTTHLFNQTSQSIIEDSKMPSIMRSPSQPAYENMKVVANSDSKSMKPGIQSSMPAQCQTARLPDLQFAQQKKSYQPQASESANGNFSHRIHSTSFDKQSFTLNQQNLDLFDKLNDTSKDLLYAKIFLGDGTASSNNIISSQSLFCYNSQLEDEQYYGSQQFSKISDIASQVPWTPIKNKKEFLKFTDDDDCFQSEIMENLDKSSEPKNYYKEFLSLKESSIFNSNILSKRRNSLGQDREKLQPQHLQFSSPSVKQSIEVSTQQMLAAPALGQNKSKSRSRQRKTTTMTSRDQDCQGD